MSEITMTVADVDDFVGNASIHLECESITIRNMLPLNGPAKSMCSNMWVRLLFQTMMTFLN